MPETKKLSNAPPMSEATFEISVLPGSLSLSLTIMHDDPPIHQFHQPCLDDPEKEGILAGNILTLKAAKVGL